ncbi:MAG: hypothetical protein ACOYOA_15870, partial [Saprospiraceae bacterium]
MKSLSSICFLLFFSYSGYSQFCAKAVPVSCGSYLKNQTTAGETTTLNTYTCSPLSFPAAEKVYKLVLDQPGVIQVSLEIGVPKLDLDLFLLSGNCTTPVCLASLTSDNAANPFEFINYRAPAGEYYIVVDGKAAANAGPFAIDIACKDLDCPNAITLQCDKTYFSNTTTASNNSSLYLNPSLNQVAILNSGNDKIHTFTLLGTQSVTLQLTGLTMDLGLFLFSECDKDKCIYWSLNPGLSAETISATLPGGKYYVVVDGARGTNGNYRLLGSWNCCTAPIVYNDCGGNPPIKYYYTGTDSNSPLQYAFQVADQATYPIIPGYPWKVRQNGVFLPTTNDTDASFNFTFPSDGLYEVCYPQVVNGCVEYCCLQVNVLHPFSCPDIEYTYNASKSSFEFTTAATSGGQWLADNGAGNAPTVLNNPILSPTGTCKSRTISYRYYDGSTWNYCSRPVYLCNPFTCGNADNLTYAYDSNSQEFEFSIKNPDSLTTYDWQIGGASPIPLGSGASVYWSPPMCASYDVIVKHYDATLKSWVTCSRSIYLCDPFTCKNTTIGYKQSSNDLLFGLSGSTSGFTGYRWTEEETKTALMSSGSSATRKCIPAQACQKYTYTLRYFDSKTWRICSAPVFICDPANCGASIAYTYSNGLLKLSVDGSNLTVSKWYVGDTEVSASSNQNPGNYTISCLYYDNTNAYFQVCSRTIKLENPPKCTTLSSPLNGELNVVLSPTITWATVADATGYRVSVGTTSGGTDVKNDVDVAAATSLALSNLSPNTQYYVKVVPYNKVGPAANCAISSFTTVGNTPLNLSLSASTHTAKTDEIVSVKLSVANYSNISGLDFSLN